MIFALARSVLLLAAVVGSLSIARASDASEPRSACPSGNLLSKSTPVESFGTIREQRLVDGKVPGRGDPVDDFVAALFLVPDAHVTFDLGSRTPVAAIQLVSSTIGPEFVSLSSDGVTFTAIQLTSDRQPAVLQTRVSGHLDTEARFIRLKRGRADARIAVAEVLAFCRVPDRFPVSLPRQKPFQEDLADRDVHFQRIRTAKCVLAVFALAALLTIPMAGDGRRARLALCLLVIGSAGWIRFGDLHGYGKLLHPWDAMHYYVGSKYFDELRYVELYRCVAAYERQQGRGYMVDRVQIRDLEDYSQHPGEWTKTPSGSCRATFTPERWREFGRDVDAFRRSFEHRHFHKTLSDHGYNATPLHTAWIQALTNVMPASPTSLAVLSGLDFLAVAISLAAIWWAFGPIAAAFAALVLGLADPWSIIWTGGSVARSVWFAALCCGMALLKRGYPLGGAVLVTISALLRLFPIVFVGALGLHVLLRSWRGKQLDRTGRRVAVGVALTLLIGIVAAGAMNGFVVYREFLDNSHVHGTVQARNQLGLGALLSYGLDGRSLQSVLSSGESAAFDSTSWRALLWMVGIFSSTLFIVRYVRKQSSLWEALPLAAPLLYCALPLAAYDYVWLVLLSPAAVGSKLRTSLLLGFAAVTNVLPQLTEDTIFAYTLINALLLLTLIGFFASWGKQLDDREDLRPIVS